jgi:hypothetical protein
LDFGGAVEPGGFSNAPVTLFLSRPARSIGSSAESSKPKFCKQQDEATIYIFKTI